MTLESLCLPKGGVLVAIASSLIAIGIDIHFSQNAFAQKTEKINIHITGDTTLPTTIHSSNNRDFVIEGGTQAGSHLFHSFDRFSVPRRGSVHFNTPLDIDIIFSILRDGAFP